MKLIYCADSNNGIGYQNTIPWHCPEDFRHFKQETRGKTIVMGVNTWNSLPMKPLQDRVNIIIKSRDREFSTDSNALVYNYDEFDRLDSRNMYLIGGAAMYKKYIQFCDEIIKTEIYGVYNCDTFFDMNENGYHFEMYKSKVIANNAIVRYFRRK